MPRLTILVIDLVQQRHLRLDDLARLLDEHPRFPGRPRIAAVLDRLEATGRVDAGSELAMRDRLTAAGVPLDPGQVRVVCRDGVPLHFDLGIARIGFLVELQSMRAHATREQLRGDVRRANQLARLPDGWRVVQASIEDLDDGWPDFLALVREVVTEQSQRWLGRPWP
ncbi:hypothetical protein GCM10011354_27070 [Egicoccus halophilus]|uniref:DUF559 domain-containing protein n=1 Tax=Egicoccus halophilus TaxID=1670830 RepID=A0A8J3AG52_9ACTN|nr:hypothetical protein GCM10011354_27070 [Egicoccus halophilus]